MSLRAERFNLCLCVIWICLTLVSLAPLPGDDAFGSLPATSRIIAIGDVHGDLAATRRVLRLAGVINNRDEWTGGNTVVVQVGDQLDRGDGEREIVHLFQKLSIDARATGGSVFSLNGNHEFMNVAGDLRYATNAGIKQFNDFTPPNSPKHQHGAGRRVAFEPGGVYARILAERNTILKIGDNVFVHAGVVPEFAAVGIETINTQSREWLMGVAQDAPDALMTRDGPVWTREFAQSPGRRECARLTEALRILGAKRMIVGHTVHESIRSECNGQIWLIDVGMSSGMMNGASQALQIIGDDVRAIRHSNELRAVSVPSEYVAVWHGATLARTDTVIFWDGLVMFPFESRNGSALHCNQEQCDVIVGSATLTSGAQLHTGNSSAAQVDENGHIAPRWISFPLQAVSVLSVPRRSNADQPEEQPDHLSNGEL